MATMRTKAAAKKAPAKKAAAKKAAQPTDRFGRTLEQRVENLEIFAFHQTQVRDRLRALIRAMVSTMPSDQQDEAVALLDEIERADGPKPAGT